MPFSTFLNGRAPTKLRGLMWLSFSDAAAIQTRAATSDSGGGATYVWSTVTTTVCRIYPVTLRGKGAVIGGQINERSTHFCELPPATTIRTQDRVVITNRGTFEVTVGLEETNPFSTRVEVFQVS